MTFKIAVAGELPSEVGEKLTLTSKLFIDEMAARSRYDYLVKRGYRNIRMVDMSTGSVLKEANKVTV